ncbi:unnamed protein product [Rotaria socialis]
MNRFTDIESKPIQLPPVYGYLSHPLLPLEKALEPIASQINQLSRYKKIAINECHFPSEHGLTRDESAAVYLSSLKPWFGYLKLFDTAIQKLPTVRKNLWRGVSKDIAKNFKKGDEFS